jgi:hypothetical protein
MERARRDLDKNSFESKDQNIAVCYIGSFTRPEKLERKTFKI